MKKLLIIALIGLFAFTLLDISYAFDSEDSEVVKRHNEWMLKVTSARDYYRQMGNEENLRKGKGDDKDKDDDNDLLLIEIPPSTETAVLIIDPNNYIAYEADERMALEAQINPPLPEGVIAIPEMAGAPEEGFIAVN